jgi:F-type H+-transporting ATPase subunit a
VTGSREKSRKFLPLVGSVFFFILLSNWLGLLPGTGSLLSGHSPVLRPANTDLNLTVAMALVSVLTSHLVGLASIGFLAHANKFIQIGTFLKSLTKGPVAIFTAVLEILVGIIELLRSSQSTFTFFVCLKCVCGEVLIL